MFRSDDSGETWQRLCAKPKLRRRAWYYMHLFADPQDPETCWVLNLDAWMSVDGGRTFAVVPTPHGDNHDLWIDPGNPRRMIEGNDGGACVSFTGGTSWSTIYNQPTAQFYHATTDTRVPYRIYGSQQDNSALSLPSRSLVGAIGASEWFVPGGGESGYIAVRPDRPDIVYGGAIGSGFGNGLLWRHDHATQSDRNITVWPEVTGMGEGADALKYRFQWTFPVELSPHDPSVLYVAGNRVFRSRDEGGSWEAISPDLTRDDKGKQAPSGGPITKDNTGAEAYDTTFTFRESPRQQGLFWAGTDDGLVHISRDGGATWEDVTPPDLPEWALVSMIDPSPHDAGAAYLAATRYKLDDCRPFLYRTDDYGKTWHAIVGGIPAHEFTRVIRADPDRPGLLYAGTETGCTSRSTTARAGPGWAARCRWCRSMIWCARMATWWRPPTGAHSGSWRTWRSCTNSPRGNGSTTSRGSSPRPWPRATPPSPCPRARYPASAMATPARWYSGCAGSGSPTAASSPGPSMTERIRPTA